MGKEDRCGHRPPRSAGRSASRGNDPAPAPADMKCYPCHAAENARKRFETGDIVRKIRCFGAR
jgi:hypothetical protein